jgi:transposase
MPPDWGGLTAVRVPSVEQGGIAGSGACARSRETRSAESAPSAGEVSVTPRPAAARRNQSVGQETSRVDQEPRSISEGALEATLADYVDEVDHVAERIVKLEKAIDEAIRQAPAEIRAVIEALQALRRVAQTTAGSIVSELGSLSRIPTASQLMGYSGLVASEHTTGNRVQRGGLTKAGNGHLRRVVVEVAWAYQHRARGVECSRRIRPSRTPSGRNGAQRSRARRR